MAGRVVMCLLAVLMLAATVAVLERCGPGDGDAHAQAAGELAANEVTRWAEHPIRGIRTVQRTMVNAVAQRLDGNWNGVRQMCARAPSGCDLYTGQTSTVTTSSGMLTPASNERCWSYLSTKVAIFGITTANCTVTVQAVR